MTRARGEAAKHCSGRRCQDAHERGAGPPADRVDLMRHHDCRDAESVLAPQLPEPVTFEPNQQLVCELPTTQIDWTTLGIGYVQ